MLPKIRPMNYYNTRNYATKISWECESSEDVLFSSSAVSRPLYISVIWKQHAKNASTGPNKFNKFNTREPMAFVCAAEKNGLEHEHCMGWLTCVYNTLVLFHLHDGLHVPFKFFTLLDWFCGLSKTPIGIKNLNDCL